MEIMLFNGRGPRFSTSPRLPLVAAFADDLSIYVGTVRDGNKLLEVIHEFESWSGLRISIPKSVATGAMYGSGTTRRQERVKADVAKRKRDAGPDILEPQIRALEAMDEALNTDNNVPPLR